jgi:hypothetical protein
MFLMLMLPLLIAIVAIDSAFSSGASRLGEPGQQEVAVAGVRRGVVV